MWTLRNKIYLKKPNFWKFYKVRSERGDFKWCRFWYVLWWCDSRSQEEFTFTYSDLVWPYCRKEASTILGALCLSLWKTNSVNPFNCYWTILCQKAPLCTGSLALQSCISTHTKGPVFFSRLDCGAPMHGGSGRRRVGAAGSASGLLLKLSSRQSVVLAEAIFASVSCVIW